LAVIDPFGYFAPAHALPKKDSAVALLRLTPLCLIIIRVLPEQEVCVRVIFMHCGSTHVLDLEFKYSSLFPGLRSSSPVPSFLRKRLSIPALLFYSPFDTHNIFAAMAALTSSTIPFEIDNQASALGFRYGYYRIIVKNTSIIKYLVVPNPAPSFPDIRGERLGFDTVPDGSWNVGYLKREAGVDQYLWDSAAEQSLATVEKIWHPRKVDYMELGDPEATTEFHLRSTAQIFPAVYNNHFGVEQVVVNIEWCPEDIYGINHETEIYSLIENQDIGPKFLAHVTENKDRVIGYMIEMVMARRAAVDDLPACRKVLSKLHNLGIAHGSLRDTDFLITNDRVLLHNFAGSYKTDEKSVLGAEMDSLEGVLRNAKPDDPTQNMGVELSAEIRAISTRDDGLHPFLFESAFRYGKITITREEHKEMLVDFRKNGWKKTG